MPCTVGGFELTERMSPVEKADKKKSGKWRQHLPSVFFLLIGAVCGILIVEFFWQLKAADNTTVELILTGALYLMGIYIALFLQIIIHETGHLLFGLMTGYKFSSFRIGSYMWIKKGEHIHFSRLSLAGTGGQCLMAPPEFVNGRIPFALYNMGGSLLNLAASLLFLGLFFLFRNSILVSGLCIIAALVGFSFALVNGIPMRLGMVDNDGYNALSLGKNPEALRAFYLQLKIHEELLKGVRIKDMPEEWFVAPSVNNEKNSLVTAISVMACNRLMDAKDFEKADDMMKTLIASDSGLVGLYRSLLTVDRIYCELIGKNRPEMLNLMLDKSLKNFMKTMKNFPSILRTQYAYALLAEKDGIKAEQFKRQFEKVALRYPHPVDIESERELMEVAETRQAATITDHTS